MTAPAYCETCGRELAFGATIVVASLTDADRGPSMKAGPPAETPVAALHGSIEAAVGAHR